MNTFGEKVDWARLCAVVILICLQAVSCAESRPDTKQTSTSADPRTFKFSTPAPMKLTGTRQRGRHDERVSSGNVIFPSEFEEEKETLSDRNTFVANANKIPKTDFAACSKGSTICEKVKDYPKQLLKDILSKTLGKANLTNTDLISDVSIKNRIGSTERSLCSAGESLVYPLAAMNKNGDWALIANYDGSDHKYIQGVKVEKCSNPGASCLYAETFPAGYVAKCKQKYIYRKLVALDPSTSKMYPDHFQIPSCCACMVSQKSQRDNSEERSADTNAEPLALTTNSAEEKIDN